MYASTLRTDACGYIVHGGLVQS